MSLITLIHVPEGIAMSTDSRTTASFRGSANQPAVAETAIDLRFTVTDACDKLFTFGPRCAAAYFGDATIEGEPVSKRIHALRRNMEDNMPEHPAEIAMAILEDMHPVMPRAGIQLLLAGYLGSEPYVFALDVAQNTLRRMNHDEKEGKVTYGIIRGGDTDVVDRLLSSLSLMPRAETMALHDAVRYSRFLIRTTIDQMEMEPRHPTVGGPIDTLAIQMDGITWLERKILKL